MTLPSRAALDDTTDELVADSEVDALVNVDRVLESLSVKLLADVEDDMLLKVVLEDRSGEESTHVEVIEELEGTEVVGTSDERLESVVLVADVIAVELDVVIDDMVFADVSLSVPKILSAKKVSALASLDDRQELKFQAFRKRDHKRIYIQDRFQETSKL